MPHARIGRGGPRGGAVHAGRCGDLHGRRPPGPAPAAERQRRRGDRARSKAVRTGGAGPGRGPLRGRAGRGRDRGFARHGQDAARWSWPYVRPARGRDGRRGGGGDGAPFLFPDPRNERGARRSSSTGTSTRWRAPTLSRAPASCSNAWRPFPWRRTRSPWCRRTTASSRSGSRRRCRSTSGATWRSCSSCGRSACASIAPDVGGGFGAKLLVYPEFAVVAAAAKRSAVRSGGPESRSESMLNLTHGRAQVQLVELGAKRDGTLVGMRVELLADMGAYPMGAFLPSRRRRCSRASIAIPRIASPGPSVVTNTTPVAPYRGAGRPEATALVERAMDLLADELDMDPVEFRRATSSRPRRSRTRPRRAPATTSGTTSARSTRPCVSRGTRSCAWSKRERRGRGDHLQLGIGVCTYVEITVVRVEGVRFGRGSRGRLGDAY